MTVKQTRKNEFVASIGFLMLLSGLVLALTYWKAGVLTTQLAGYSMLLVVPAMIGVLFGERIRQLIPSRVFKKLVYLLVLFIGMNLIRRGMIM